ncbi:dTDP-4-dehydrorhamnose 3,5-epimerase [Sphingomonas sp. T1]|uniref:dTDP-4-dehydrorhamnose 3,5-epimerase n=1 Tax=Sphingomonas sp. T1 TaxID=2653172 RepID=UPI00135693C0|nr:dTDP-4-dehydrorhamnose 3,5-epimerase [Sphingomonas sp. T1]
MIYSETRLKDAWLIDIEPRGDARGSFARTFCHDEFGSRGMVANYVQQNMSVSAQKGTVRGMHFQRGQHAEAKLIRCTRGSIMDVIVDLRGGSPTYLRHEAFELSADNRRQLYVPPGFAHSFQTLADDIEVTYLVSAPYTPSAEGGVRYNDPLLAIKWPLPISVISDKDENWPLLDPDNPSLF